MPATHDPMTLLKRDHAEAKELLMKLGRSEPGKQREQMCTEVTAALELHMQIEEMFVYPLVQREEGKEVRVEADTEHGIARKGLKMMNDLVAKPGFGAAAEALLGGILHHVKEEETEVLPALQKALPKEEWQQLGEQIAQAKEAGKVPARSTSR